MIAAAPPAVSDPTLVFLGRTIPATGGPDVVVAFVAVIAGDPHITPIRWPAAIFVNGRRRRDADHNLRKRCRGAKSESEQ